jgi:hypothetical protein
MITFIVLSTPLQLLTSLTLIYKSDRRNLDPEGCGSGLTRDVQVHSHLLPENIMWTPTKWQKHDLDTRRLVWSTDQANSSGY